MTSTYRIPTTPYSIDLDLSKNEGPAPSLEEFSKIENLAQLSNRYPATDELRAAIATRHHLDVDQVLVTAGGDDALSRCFLAIGNRSVVTTTPTFEMVRNYAAQARCALTEIPWWEGSLPIDELVATARDSEMAVVVSPNNPTGQVLTADDLRSLAAAAPRVVLDAAYAEFAENDLTPLAIELGNVLVIRTMSKAFGLAGMRVGYLLGPAPLIAEISAFGGPYPISGVSAHLAEKALRGDEGPRNAFVQEVKRERDELRELIEEFGGTTLASEANFVLTRWKTSQWLVNAAGSLGIGLRAFREPVELTSWVRITLPGDRCDFERLTSGLRTICAPQCILFDLDGVIVDVSRSYRAAIIATAAQFGATVTRDQVLAAKAEGNANDDWDLTTRLCRSSGISVARSEVIECFESIYHGSAGQQGLKAFERPLIEPAQLRDWSRRIPLGVVTGRPRKDALEVLDRFDLTQSFSTVVTREDAPMKPDPAPVSLALSNLGAETGWMLGDTQDDLMAARHAGVLPVGVVSPSDDPSLARAVLAQAAIVLDTADQLEEILNDTQI